MATPAEKLASSLEVLQELQKQGVVAIRSSRLTRTHRERLVKNGFLQEVMKGWYISARPNETAGESTAWYASFWDFCTAYLEERFGDKWSLSPEQSLSVHAENWTVPGQLLARTVRGDNKPVALPHNTSLFIFRGRLPGPEQSAIKQGLRLYSLPAALTAAGPAIFRQHPTDMRVALAMIQDASEVLSLLLEGGHSRVAGRLAGAFRNIGNDKIADQIIKTMRTADFKVREEDPFEAAANYQPPPRERSPYVNRLSLMWQEMREQVIGNFPQPPGLPADRERYLKHIDDVYVTDAYHSLSIEGYRVSPELGRQRRDALAARGYWQAHQRARETMARIIAGENPGETTDADLSDWYQELFGPSVTAGLLKPADLFGYRTDQVYIRNSFHTPPRVQAVRECMPEVLRIPVRGPDPAPLSLVLPGHCRVRRHPY